MAKNPDKNISIGGNSLSVWHAENSWENETTPSFEPGLARGKHLKNIKYFTWKCHLFKSFRSQAGSKPDIFSLSTCIIEDISKFCKEKKLLHQIFLNFKAWNTYLNWGFLWQEIHLVFMTRVAILLKCVLIQASKLNQFPC